MAVRMEKLPTVLDEETLASMAERGKAEAGDLLEKAYRKAPAVKPYRDRFKRLCDVRRDMEPIWTDIRDYLYPEGGRFLNGDDPFPGDETYRVNMDNIVDSSPAKALSTAASGLHGGLTSPSVQWFSGYVGDYQEYKDNGLSEIKDWVYQAETCVRDVLANSNFYAAIQKFYKEELAVGTAAMLIADDLESVARFICPTFGTYWLGQGDDLRINVLYRRMASTAKSIVGKYGKKNAPRLVLEAMDRGDPDRRFYIIQCIQPWNDFGNQQGKGDFAYEDVRFVEGTADDESALFLGGYKSKPFVATRWGDSGDYVYGRDCPGMASLPDNLQLQVMTLAANKAMEWQVNPAFAVPSGMKEAIGNSLTPGTLVPYDGDPRSMSVAPILPNMVNLEQLTAKCQDLRQLVQDAFFNRYFVLIQSRTRQMTATEVMQLIQEKSDLLGPVVMQNMSEALAPMLDRVFDLAVINGLLPPPPPAIAGKELKFFFTSSLAIAQRQAALSGMNTFTAWIAQMMGSGFVDVADVVDVDAWVREIAETGQVPASIIRGEDEVETIREARAQQQAQQQKLAGVQQAAATANALGNTPVGPDNALGLMLEAEGGAEGAAQ